MVGIFFNVILLHFICDVFIFFFFRMTESHSSHQFTVETHRICVPIWTIGNGHVESLACFFPSTFPHRHYHLKVSWDGIRAVIPRILRDVMPTKPLLVIIDILFNDLLSRSSPKGKRYRLRRNFSIDALRTDYRHGCHDLQKAIWASGTDTRIVFVVPEGLYLNKLNNLPGQSQTFARDQDIISRTLSSFESWLPEADFRLVDFFRVIDCLPRSISTNLLDDRYSNCLLDYESLYPEFECFRRGSIVCHIFMLRVIKHLQFLVSRSTAVFFTNLETTHQRHCQVLRDLRADANGFFLCNDMLLCEFYKRVSSFLETDTWSSIPADLWDHIHDKCTSNINASSNLDERPVPVKPEASSMPRSSHSFSACQSLNAPTRCAAPSSARNMSRGHPSTLKGQPTDKPVVCHRGTSMPVHATSDVSFQTDDSLGHEFEQVCKKCKYSADGKSVLVDVDMLQEIRGYLLALLPALRPVQSSQRDLLSLNTSGPSSSFVTPLPPTSVHTSSSTLYSSSSDPLLTSVMDPDDEESLLVSPNAILLPEVSDETVLNIHPEDEDDW